MCDRTSAYNVEYLDSQLCEMTDTEFNPTRYRHWKRLDAIKTLCGEQCEGLEDRYGPKPACPVCILTVNTIGGILQLRRKIKPY